MDWLPDNQNFLDDEEKRFLEKLAQADPTSPALLRLAQEHIRQNRPALAVQITRPITEAHPFHPGAAVVLAHALAGTGQKVEAERVLKMAALNPDILAKWLNYAAEAWKQIGNTAEARRAESAAGALRGEKEAEYPQEEAEPAGEAVPTITLARLYMQQGYTDRAIAVCRQILNKTPDHQQAQDLLAELTSSDLDQAVIPEDLIVEPSGPSTDYSAIQAQKEAQLLAEPDESDAIQGALATDYTAIEALADEEEILASEAAEDDDLKGLDIPEEAVATDYSAVEAASEAHDLEDLDVPEEAALTDYTAIKALEEEEDGGLPEPEDLTDEDWTLPEPEDEEPAAEDLEGLDVPEETVSTDYSAVEAASEAHDLEDLDVPEEAALTDYTAIKALEEAEEGLPEPEDLTDEDWTLPEPEDEEAVSEDLEGLDVPKETVSTDYSAVEAASEAHDLEDLDVPEEAALTDYTAIKALEEAEDDLPEPEDLTDEDWSLPEPDDEEPEAEGLESPAVPEEAAATDFDALEADDEELAIEDLDLPEDAALIEKALAEEEDGGLPEPEDLTDEDWSLPEPDDEEPEAESLESPEGPEEPAAPDFEDIEAAEEEFVIGDLDEPEEPALAEDNAVKALEEEADSPPAPDSADSLTTGIQDEPEPEQDWDSEPSESLDTNATMVIDFESIQELDAALEEEQVEIDQEDPRTRKKRLAERLEKMRNAAARRRQQLEDEPR